MENEEIQTGTKKTSFEWHSVKELLLSWFKQYKLLVILGSVFLLLVMFYGVSKYIRKEIVKNMNFAMPKIDVGKDNDKNSKKTSDGEMLAYVKQGVEDEKLKDKSTLKVQDKGLKTFQGSKAFAENTSSIVENEPTKVVEKPPVVEIPKVIPLRTILRDGGRKRYSKAAVTPQTKPIENNTFNTTSLENTTTITNPQRKKELIKAAIYGTQVVRNNSTVRIRLLEAMTIEDEIIPANTLCSGVAMIGGNRLIIMVTAFKIGADYIPAKMVVYDSNDMLPGIAYLSDNTKGQIRQQNNQAIDNVDNMVYNIGSSVGIVGQVGAGVVTGISRSLRYGGVQKKSGEIELNEGYKVFLKPN
ncbi:conjugative transposon protein TraM [Emticicia sp.]|uniref:conjugative transposon protein TraM n=1 Tax=Emticicia sp. TaxID=1930953 RepID=UPI003752AB70